MTKERKQSAEWYIAATHYLTAGFVIPLLISVAWSLIVRIINLRSGMVVSGTTMNIFSLLLGAIAVWLGVMYSANYLKKKYIIQNKERIVRTATIYMIVLTLGFYLITFYLARSQEGLISKSDLLHNGLSIFVIISLFYLFSKKYIKNTEGNEVQMQ